MSGVTAAAIVGGSALVGGGLAYLGAHEQAGAAQDAANSQYAIGQQQIADQKAAREKAAALAAPSAAELAQMDQLYKVQAAALDNQWKQLEADRAMLNSVDPAIRSAGEQAYKILNGQSSALLNPVLAQRDRQRNQLEQTLKDRMGPGYAESSAGASALRQFDQDTQLTTASIQQQTLGELLGTSQFGASLGRNDIMSGFSQLANLSTLGINASANQTNRLVNAFTGNPVTGYTPLMEAAGNQSIGATISGQALGNVGSTIAGAGGQLGTMYASGIQSANNNATLMQLLGRNNGPSGVLGSEVGSSFSPSSGLGFNSSGASLANTMNSGY